MPAWPASALISPISEADGVRGSHQYADSAPWGTPERRIGTESTAR